MSLPNSPRIEISPPTPSTSFSSPFKNDRSQSEAENKATGVPDIIEPTVDTEQIVTTSAQPQSHVSLVSGQTSSNQDPPHTSPPTTPPPTLKSSLKWPGVHRTDNLPEETKPEGERPPRPLRSASDHHVRIEEPASSPCPKPFAAGPKTPNVTPVERA